MQLAMLAAVLAFMQREPHRPDPALRNDFVPWLWISSRYDICLFAVTRTGNPKLRWNTALEKES